MSEHDRIRWDERYSRAAPVPVEAIGLPGAFARYEDVFPTVGRAYDLGCGQGTVAVWLARRGMRVWGYDVSEVAIDRARDLARRSGISDRCRFDVADLDHGLPGGADVDVIVCHKFRDRRLDRDIVARLAPGGLLAISALSQVGAAGGSFRVVAGELRACFAELDIIDEGDGGDQAWLLARAPRSGIRKNPK